MYPGAIPAARGMLGGARPAINAGVSLSATTTVVLSAVSSVVVFSESVWGKRGRRWRLSSDATSSVALIEQKSCHLLHHLMLILIEEILLLGQCLDVLAHLLGRIGGLSCRELALICQRRHLRRNRFSGVFVRFVAGESTKRILLKWKGGCISLMACGGGCCI